MYEPYKPIVHFAPRGKYRAVISGWGKWWPEKIFDTLDEVFEFVRSEEARNRVVDVWNDNGECVAFCHFGFYTRKTFIGQTETPLSRDGQ